MKYTEKLKSYIKQILLILQREDESPPSTPKNLKSILSSSALIKEFREFLQILDSAGIIFFLFVQLLYNLLCQVVCQFDYWGKNIVSFKQQIFCLESIFTNKIDLLSKMYKYCNYCQLRKLPSNLESQTCTSEILPVFNLCIVFENS